jgi:DNA-binding transcriptional LysR family regulator
MYFHEVVRFGGISKAANHLHQSQPNLTRAVQNLETELNETLLLRSKKGIRLTPKGEEVFQLSKRYLETTNEIEGTLFGNKTQMRIGASENLVLHLLPKIFKKVSGGAEQPLLIFSGTSEQIEAELLALTIDRAIFYHAPAHSELKQKILGKVEFVVITQKGTRAKTPKDLVKLNFVGSRVTDYAKPYFALKAIQQLGLRPIQTIECNSQEAQVRLVEEGFGFSLVPDFMLEGRRDRFEILRVGVHAPLYWVSKTNLLGEKAEYCKRIENELKKKFSGESI